VYFIFLCVLSKKICWKWVIWFIKSIGEFMPSFLLLKLSDTKQVNETSFSLTNNALSMLFFVQKKKQWSTCHPPSYYYYYYYYYYFVIVVVEIQSSQWTFDFYSSTCHSLLLKRKTLWSKWVDMAEAHMTGPLKTTSTCHVGSHQLISLVFLLLFFFSISSFNKGFLFNFF